MKNKISLFILVAIVIAGISLVGCRKKDDPAKGKIVGKITNFTSGANIADAKILVYDASQNAPVGGSYASQTDGTYSIDLNPGTYFLKITKQGFNPIPPAGFSPLVLNVTAGGTVTADYKMQTSTVVNGAVITGKVTAGGNPVSGVLVVANSTTDGFSDVTDAMGNYSIFNVPAGTYKVKGFKSEFNTDSVEVAATAGNIYTGKNITLTKGVTGKVTGKITFASTNNGDVDVTLVNPYTMETVPGLTTKSLTGDYTISNVPNGTYIARASYNNDTYVVDPDWILKNGEPLVTINNNTIQLNFTVTGAVTLITPTNAMSSTQPVEVSATGLTFTWGAYSSTSDYVIEVIDVNGNLIWGGFTKNGAVITKNIVISKALTSIEFNSDGKATGPLQVGMIYRWKIYSSKDDTNPLGWKLLSSSEDQMGLIKIIP